jgi:hypothetical protein
MRWWREVTTIITTGCWDTTSNIVADVSGGRWYMRRVSRRSCRSSLWSLAGVRTGLNIISGESICISTYLLAGALPSRCVRLVKPATLISMGPADSSCTCSARIAEISSKLGTNHATPPYSFILWLRLCEGYKVRECGAAHQAIPPRHCRVASPLHM